MLTLENNEERSGSSQPTVRVRKMGWEGKKTRRDTWLLEHV